MQALEVSLLALFWASEVGLCPDWRRTKHSADAPTCLQLAACPPSLATVPSPRSFSQLSSTQVEV